MPADPPGSSPAPLRKLNDQVYLSPRDHTVPYDPVSPSVILLFGWFNGKLPHEKKYVDVLKGIYPTASVVLVKIDASWLWKTQAGREAALEPVADVLQEARDVEARQGFRGVLVHVMSNGGGMQLLVLSKVLERRARVARKSRHQHHQSAATGPVALILDSLPEGNGLRCMISVYTLGTQQMGPVSKAAAIPFLTFFYCLFYLWYGGPALQEVRTRLNLPSILPGFTPGDTKEARGDLASNHLTPRLYVYSRTDQLTRTEEVQSHIHQASRAGFDVRTEVFEDTPHVSHARVEPERYWAAVDKLWRDARSKVVAKAKL